MIRTAGLSKHYRSSVALDDVTFTIPAGSVVGVLGPNGAGKSTLLRLLLGLTRPTAGSALVLGRDVGLDALAVRRSVALVPDSKAIPESRNVASFLRFYLSFFPNADPEIAATRLARWGIAPTRRIGTLSRGETSKVLLAAVLARQARLILLDEPSEGLDLTTVEDLWSNLFESITRSDEAGVLLATHRLDEIERLCDRILVLHQGKLVLAGDLDEIRAGWRRLMLRPHASVTASPPPGVRVRNGVVEAIVTDWDEEPPAELAAIGEVVSVTPMGLREIYLSLVGDAA